jgi:uncharacterized membrane protein YgcG
MRTCEILKCLLKLCQEVILISNFALKNRIMYAGGEHRILSSMDISFFSLVGRILSSCRFHMEKLLFAKRIWNNSSRRPPGGGGGGGGGGGAGGGAVGGGGRPMGGQGRECLRRGWQ